MPDSTTLQLLNQLNAFAQANATQIWIVGGFIRDQLLNLDSDDADIDLVFETDVNNIVGKLAEFIGCEYKSFEEFKTAKLIGLNGKLETLDIATMRSEVYLTPGALPSVSLGNFEQDYKRRDFTINALYYKLSDYIKSNFVINLDLVVDKRTGLEDLSNKLVRVLHQQSFIEDPTRLFRAIRYKIRCNAQLEKESSILFDQALKLSALKTVSRQRILGELRKACQSAEWKLTLNAFVESSLMQHANLVTVENQKVLLKLIQAFDAEPFDMLCASLYFLDQDTARFQEYGFGRKFFKAAKSRFKYFESKINVTGQ